MELWVIPPDVVEHGLLCTVKVYLVKGGKVVHALWVELYQGLTFKHEKLLRGHRGAEERLRRWIGLLQPIAKRAKAAELSEEQLNEIGLLWKEAKNLPPLVTEEKTTSIVYRAPDYRANPLVMDNVSEVLEFIGLQPPCSVCGGHGEYESEYGPKGCNPCVSRLIAFVDHRGGTSYADWGDTIERRPDGLHLIQGETQ